jgi:hypothetical protein
MSGRLRITAPSRGTTSEDAVRRASERVTLACRALTEAVRDLRVAHKQRPIPAVDDAADSVAAETERVCELGEEVAKLAANLERTLTLAGRSG